MENHHLLQGVEEWRIKNFLKIAPFAPNEKLQLQLVQAFFLFDHYNLGFYAGQLVSTWPPLNFYNSNILKLLDIYNINSSTKTFHSISNE
ncbi:hypothetical protein DERF_008642 [Dermatophagoides farinae]|uniref:Uncharacterized protein n=1 Tax=Dermatophagoides farinae TaxID=6954 RepID=A0A922L765_DERFA|nr:hypothetical protein DERF_008642 [Dermatophagoides farinae]